MNKIFIIYNPVSGKNKLRNVPERIQKFLKSRKIEYDWFQTLPVPHQPLEQFNFNNYERVIVVGGDGTIREVAQFFIRHTITVPLAIIAQGSANVLATTLGIPIFPLERALQFALQRSPRSLDVIAVNRERLALVAAGQGYDTLFIRSASRALKRQFGWFAYIISFLRTFFTYANHRYKIVVDGTRYDAIGKVALVFNSLSLVGFPIDAAISPVDGFLNLIIFSPRSLPDLIQMGFWLLFHRSFTRVPRIQVFTGKKISINRHHAKHVHIDGEVFRGKNLQLEVLPRALMVIYDKAFT